ncbi:uncharacterized protein G2W53_035013 [Senna tora]|uniref:Uncharacterized protein n=1 Tax=Senna tora TaxID=362788 RepID=A0A834SPH4_9FABA|nr:uncharacterized protein G2W53_035013 [Senna tora]
MRESTLNSQDQEHEVHHNSEEVQEIGSSRGKGKDQGKSTSSGLSSYFMPRTTQGAQPTLKSVLQSEEARERCDLAISKWMVDACLPFNAVNFVYYQLMIDAIANIGKLPEVNEVVDHAAKLTKLIYNHCFALHLMRTHTGGREILRPAPTCFATNFVALQSILAQKDALRAMVTCREWTTSSFARESKSKKFVDAVLDSGFWKNCATIVKLTEPLIRDKQLYKNLHAIGFWFNPSYHYDTNEMEKHKSDISGVLDVIERYAHNDRALEEKLNEEVTIFRNAEEDFGRRLALNSRHTKMPEDEPPTLTVEEIEALNRELTECTIEENHPDIGRSSLPSLKEAFSEVRREESRKKINNTNTSHTPLEHSTLTTRGPVEQLQRQGVPTTKYCDHCHKKGYTKDTCWEIHGKPPNWKPQSRSSAAHHVETTDSQPFSQTKLSFSKNSLVSHPLPLACQARGI